MFFHTRRSNARNVGVGVSHKQRDRLPPDELYLRHNALQLWCEDRLRGRLVQRADVAQRQPMEQSAGCQYGRSHSIQRQATHAPLQGHGMTTAPKRLPPSDIGGFSLAY